VSFVLNAILTLLCFLINNYRNNSSFVLYSNYSKAFTACYNHDVYKHNEGSDLAIYYIEQNSFRSKQLCQKKGFL